MRIAYLASQFPCISETFVWRETIELRRRGWHVLTFALHPADSIPGSLAALRVSTTDVYTLPPRASWRGLGTLMRDLARPAEKTSWARRLKLAAQWSAAVRLAPILQQAKVQHIHAHFAHAPATVAMYAAQQAGIPFSFTGHANDLFQNRQLLRRKLQRAAFVSCISRWHQQFYHSIWPRDASQYPLIRCGVPLPTSTSQTACRPRNVLAPLEIATVCRLVEKKGVDTLLRAAALVRDRQIELRITIAGDGPQRTALMSLARSCGLDDRVTFLGAVDNTHVQTLLRQSHLFVLPCRIDSRGDRDGIPVALIEAMALGVPVIAGDLPTVRELVQPDVTGVLVDGASPQGTARAILRVARNRDWAEQMTRRAAERVRTEFSLTPNVCRLEQAILAAQGDGKVKPGPVDCRAGPRSRSKSRQNDGHRNVGQVTRCARVSRLRTRAVGQVSNLSYL